MLRFTGHPLFDVGAATIGAFVGKRDLSTITVGDLERVADCLTEQYTVDPLKTFLVVAFPNSGFVQPAYAHRIDKRLEYAKEVLRAYRSDVPKIGMKCAFTGRPAVAVVFRQHVPLITGEDIVNFHPGGNPGLPVSGEALLCIQAFPLGCAKCSGRLLAVHSDNGDLTYEFAEKFLQMNMAAISMAQAAGSTKMPEAKARAGTLLIDTLLQLEEARLEESGGSGYGGGQPCSLTAYHLTNSGQSNPLDPRNPPLQIYHLPLEMMSFLRSVVSAEYRHEWKAIASRAWEVPKPKKRKRGDARTEGEGGPRRNFLYEDVLKLPDNARYVLRTYFLRTAVRWAKRDESDPRSSYSLREEADLVSWKLTDLFLRKVMNVDRQRVEQIRALGDRLAEYVSAQNDKGFFRNFFTLNNYGYFRAELIKADASEVRRGQPPLITFDQFIEIFEEGDEIARPDWRLARDLVLIRMVEQLHQRGWLARNREVVPEIESEPVLEVRESQEED
ncbi:MAG: type I-B CRISPR-associated protein Cas8b1/Cst1 [Bacillota bacterium]